MCAACMAKIPSSSGIVINPRFHGRDRTNTPMWLLRTMLWSGLFEEFEILQRVLVSPSRR